MTQKCVVHNRILENWFALYEDAQIVELKRFQKYSNIPDIGNRYFGIIRKIDLRQNAAFVEIETGVFGFLKFKMPRPNWLIEGKKIIVEVSRRAFDDKSCIINFIGDAPIGQNAPQIIEKIKEPKNWPKPIEANSEEISQIEELLEDLQTNQIEIPKGGNFAVNQTRAICAIDIDSNGRETGGKNQAHFNKSLNFEAASIIAHHIRLRNLCGLIIIDFAGNLDPASASQIENILRQKIGPQNAKIFFNYKLGICEIARERTNEPLHEIFSNQDSALVIRHAIEAIYNLSVKLRKSKGQKLIIETSPQILSFLEQCDYNWREYIQENIGGSFEIIPCRNAGFEVLIK